MNILAIGAHPDDVELGCFGTLLEKKSKGHGVYAVALAPGAYGSHTKDKVLGAWAKARDVLTAGGGGAEYVLGEFPIGGLRHDWATVGFVDELIEEYGIDTVLTHHYGEAHQDHLAAQKIAVSAARRHVDSLWLWETSIYTHRSIFPFRAQLYVPMSRPSFEGKMHALAGYLEADMLGVAEVDAQRHLAGYRGAETHSEFAESFEVVWTMHIE